MEKMPMEHFFYQAQSEEQAGAATVTVGVGTQNEGAEGTHEKARAEGHQRKHERTESTIAGEKGFPDGGGIVAEHHEVVHLQKISTGDADNGPDLGITFRGRDHLGLLEAIVHV